MSQGCYFCNSHKLKLKKITLWPFKECQNCHLVQVHPRPTTKQISSLYSGDYYKNYSYYLSQKQIHFAYFQKKIEDIKNIIPSGTILDIGCALGYFLEIAKKNGYFPLGIDISDYAVKVCRKKHLKAIQGDISLIDTKKPFDIITSFETIEHERDPLQAIQHTYKLLKKGGLAVYTTPNYDTILRRIMNKSWFGYGQTEHLFIFTPQTIKAFFTKAGFKDIEVKIDQPRPYLLYYCFKRAAYYFNTPIIRKFLLLLASLFEHSHLSFPFNPWKNIIVFAKKK